MHTTEIRAAILEIIRDIVRDEDLSDLESGVRIRDQIEMDSMDFLDIVMELRKRYGVTVPEDDYMELSTLDGAVEYLEPLLKDVDLEAIQLTGRDAVDKTRTQAQARDELVFVVFAPVIMAVAGAFIFQFTFWNLILEFVWGHNPNFVQAHFHWGFVIGAIGGAVIGLGVLFDRIDTSRRRRRTTEPN